MKNWIDNPQVNSTGLVRLDDFSVIQQEVQERIDHSHSVPYLNEYKVRWQFSVRIYVQDDQERDFSVTHAKRALRAELYKDIRLCLDRMHLALSNRDLKAAHLVLDQLDNITRPQ